MSYIDKEFKIFNHAQDIRMKGPMFECDELIAPVISILNRKGFITKSCCSGHLTPICMDSMDLFPGTEVQQSDTYISFEMSREDLSHNGFIIPKGFKFDSENYDIEYFGYRSIIRKSYSNDDDHRWVKLLNTAQCLYNWALNDVPTIEGMLLSSSNGDVSLVRNICDIENNIKYDYREIKYYKKESIAGILHFASIIIDNKYFGSFTPSTLYKLIKDIEVALDKKQKIFDLSIYEQVSI